MLPLLFSLGGIWNRRLGFRSMSNSHLLMSPPWAILVLNGCPWPDDALAMAIVPPLAVFALAVRHLSLLITGRQGSEHPHGTSPLP